MTRGISAAISASALILALAFLRPSHSQPAVTMPDKEKKSISSHFRKFRDHKSDPASNTTGVVNDRECTIWLFPQALTLHAARSLSSKDSHAGRQAIDASPSASQDSLRDPQPSAGTRPQGDGTLTVFRYFIDLTLSSRCFPG